MYLETASGGGHGGGGESQLLRPGLRHDNSDEDQADGPGVQGRRLLPQTQTRGWNWQ